MGREEVQLHTFLTLAPDGDEWSASCPGHFPPQGKSHQYPLVRRLDGHQSKSGCSDDKKFQPLVEIEPQSSSL